MSGRMRVMVRVRSISLRYFSQLLVEARVAIKGWGTLEHSDYFVIVELMWEEDCIFDFSCVADLLSEFIGAVEVFHLSFSGVGASGLIFLFLFEFGAEYDSLVVGFSGIFSDGDIESGGEDSDFDGISEFGIIANTPFYVDAFGEVGGKLPYFVDFVGAERFFGVARADEFEEQAFRRIDIVALE